ncbi:MAG: iron chelate uptake ABC transporter family permease subunit [Candidatus Delongbacteria bacterium]
MIQLDHMARVVLTGCALIGLTGGALGTFVVLRRQSLVGDVVSHAALPGIVLAFWLTGSRSTPALAAGAALAGLIGMLAASWILRRTLLREDGVLGLVLSSFFGLGLMGLTWIQRQPDAAQAGLDRYLFGNAATLLSQDLAWMAGAALLVAGTLALLWKEFSLLAFDADFAAQLGWPVRQLDLILTLLTVVVIVLGLQTVGVVLMSTLLIAPAVAARQWTDRLGRMTLLAGGLGALAGVLGGAGSLAFARLPTGPAIVLAASGLVLLSLGLGTRGGWLWSGLRRRRLRREGGEALLHG